MNDKDYMKAEMEKRILKGVRIPIPEKENKNITKSKKEYTDKIKYKENKDQME